MGRCVRKIDFSGDIVYNDDIGSGEYIFGDVNDHQTKKAGDLS